MEDARPEDLASSHRSSWIVPWVKDLHSWVPVSQIFGASRPKPGPGFQVDAAQRGLDPTDWKPLSTVGAGARAAVLNMRADLMGDLRELKRPLVYGRITIVPRPSGSMSGAGASTQGSPSAPTPSESCRTTGSPRGSGSMHPCQSPSAVSRVVSRWRRPSERTATTATTAGITRAAASHGFVRRA